MELKDVIAASTINAAMALKRSELGSLKPGCAGDATILTVREGKFDYVDVTGEHMAGDRRIVSEGVVMAGRWWHPKRSQKFRNQNVRSQRTPVIPTGALGSGLRPAQG
jgi:dihydroorotase